VCTATRCDEWDVVLAQVFAYQSACVAGGAVDDNGLLAAAHVLSPDLVVCGRAAASHSHAAIDWQPHAGDETRGIRTKEDNRVGHVGYIAQPARRRLLDDCGDSGLRRREQTGG